MQNLTTQDIQLIELAIESHISSLEYRFEKESGYIHPSEKYIELLEKIKRQAGLDYPKKLQEFLEDYQQMRKTQTEYFILKKTCPGLAGGILVRSKEQERDLDKEAEAILSEMRKEVDHV